MIEQAIWQDWTHQMLREYVQEAGVERIMVSTVAQSANDLIQYMEDQVQILELTHETALPFQNLYATPKTLGKDRLAAVAGAHSLYGSSHCLVVDAGTCIKYDLMMADGRYLGGNIAPGLQMRIEAMHHFTARLPVVRLDLPSSYIGTSTETALQNGSVRAALLEIEGFYRLFQTDCPNLKVILTGGDAAFLIEHLGIENLVLQPDLVLFGLQHILDHDKYTKPLQNK